MNNSLQSQDWMRKIIAEVINHFVTGELRVDSEFEKDTHGIKIPKSLSDSLQKIILDIVENKRQ